ncbi:hypothetical protein B0H16DRAFT_1462226 [Mycena metata]|uniref:Uncharacterized protein n=1 Tax=Mycena metata TaxID=1033252 RepID=A0AAD7IN73_9AGAR|nr:hypothetical protein B0H16DRAFT_1462226 [Mycena metata]
MNTVPPFYRHGAQRVQLAEQRRAHCTRLYDESAYKTPLQRPGGQQEATVEGSLGPDIILDQTPEIGLFIVVDRQQCWPQVAFTAAALGRVSSRLRAGRKPLWKVKSEGETKAAGRIAAEYKTDKDRLPLNYHSHSWSREPSHRPTRQLAEVLKGQDVGIVALAVDPFASGGLVLHRMHFAARKRAVLRDNPDARHEGLGFVVGYGKAEGGAGFEVRGRVGLACEARFPTPFLSSSHVLRALCSSGHGFNPLTGRGGGAQNGMAEHQNSERHLPLNGASDFEGAGSARSLTTRRWEWEKEEIKREIRSNSRILGVFFFGNGPNGNSSAEAAAAPRPPTSNNASTNIVVLSNQIQFPAVRFLRLARMKNPLRAKQEIRDCSLQYLCVGPQKNEELSKDTQFLGLNLCNVRSTGCPNLPGVFPLTTSSADNAFADPRLLSLRESPATGAQYFGYTAARGHTVGHDSCPSHKIPPNNIGAKMELIRGDSTGGAASIAARRCRARTGYSDTYVSREVNEKMIDAPHENQKMCTACPYERNLKTNPSFDTKFFSHAPTHPALISALLPLQRHGKPRHLSFTSTLACPCACAVSAPLGASAWHETSMTMDNDYWNGFAGVPIGHSEGGIVGHLRARTSPMMGKRRRDDETKEEAAKEGRGRGKKVKWVHLAFTDMHLDSGIEADTVEPRARNKAFSDTFYQHDTTPRLMVGLVRKRKVDAGAAIWERGCGYALDNHPSGTVTGSWREEGTLHRVFNPFCASAILVNTMTFPALGSSSVGIPEEHPSPRSR